MAEKKKTEPQVQNSIIPEVVGTMRCCVSSGHGFSSLHFVILHNDFTGCSNCHSHHSPMYGFSLFTRRKQTQLCPELGAMLVTCFGTFCASNQPANKQSEKGLPKRARVAPSWVSRGQSNGPKRNAT